MPPRSPWAAPGPPPAAPSLPWLGFAFFWHRLLWGFSPFLGSPWFPSDLVCACVELELYITPRGAGAEPREGGMGAGGGATSALPCQGGPETPRPHACPCTPRLPLDQMWGQQGHGGVEFGTIHFPLPPSTPSRPRVPPPGIPHVPGPPMSLRGRSPPRSVTPVEGGARGRQDPWGPLGHAPTPPLPGRLPPPIMPA